MNGIKIKNDEENNRSIKIYKKTKRQ